MGLDPRFRGQARREQMKVDRNDRLYRDKYNRHADEEVEAVAHGRGRDTRRYQQWYGYGWLSTAVRAENAPIAGGRRDDIDSPVLDGRIRLATSFGWDLNQPQVAATADGRPVAVGQQPGARFAARGQLLAILTVDIHLFAPAPVDPHEDLMRAGRHLESPRFAWAQLTDHLLVDHHFEWSQVLSEPARYTLHFD